VWADENQIVRVAFIDSNDDIVQVELSGKGELAIEFEEGAYSPPRSPGFQPSEDWGLSGHWTSNHFGSGFATCSSEKKNNPPSGFPRFPKKETTTCITGYQMGQQAELPTPNTPWFMPKEKQLIWSTNRWFQEAAGENWVLIDS